MNQKPCKKRINFYTLFTLLLLSITAQSCFSQPQDKSAPVINGGFAVLELFTSEGCSSCPSADALIPVLKDKYKDALFTLSFHVDYWNRLGWKDEFSSSKYSARQNEYASAFGANSVYTPQAVINGTKETTGSDKAGLQKMIEGELKYTRSKTIQLSAVRKNEDKLIVTYQTDMSNDEVLHIALVQLHAETQVKSGENSGRKLKHDNVVRVFETTKKNKGEITLEIPAGLQFSDCNVIGYTQQKSNMKITGASVITL